jgi:hypothetical protein
VLNVPPIALFDISEMYPVTGLEETICQGHRI